MNIVGGICIQCALREFVEQLEKGLDPMEQPMSERGFFEGSPLAHQQQHHADLAECQRERADLEERAARGMASLIERKTAKAKAARNN